MHACIGDHHHLDKVSHVHPEPPSTKSMQNVYVGLVLDLSQQTSRCFSREEIHVWNRVRINCTDKNLGYNLCVAVQETDFRGTKFINHFNSV